MRAILLVMACLVAQLAIAQKGKTAYPDGLFAEVSTSKGMIVIRLEFEKVPMTVANFVGLSEGTIENANLPIGKHYYDGSRWHRVVPGHVIQCGRPARSSAGSAGAGFSTEKFPASLDNPGYDYPNEIVPGLSHNRIGVVGIANSGPHTNGSQWYITLGDRSYLDGDYTIFGEVIKGLDVLPLVTEEDSIKTVKIVRVGKAAEAFRPTTASVKELVLTHKIAALAAEKKRREDEEQFIQQSWPYAQISIRQYISQEGEGPPTRRGDKLRVRYKGQILGGDSFVSTSDEGKPWYGDSAAPFEYVVGTTTINPGFDACVSQMRKGEKRVLILNAMIAYGLSGYYPPERKGGKRFHVGPYKTLIYEVEVVDILR